jgi:hypothetical protein
VAAPWSEAELALIRDTSLSLAEVAKRTGRSRDACRVKAESQKIRRYGWSDTELALLYDISVPLVEVAVCTGRPLGSVRSKASYLKIARRADEWSEAELHLLADMSLSYAEVAARTGRSFATVKSRASLTGVPRRLYPASAASPTGVVQRAQAARWAAWELELLADPDLSLTEVMQYTGRTWASVQLKASRSKFRRRLVHPGVRQGRNLYGLDWQEVRRGVLERDGYTCQETGCSLYVPSGKGLHVHHVIPFRLHPVTEPRWLLTLCIFHHLSRPEHWWKVLPPHVETLLAVDRSGGGEPL